MGDLLEGPQRLIGGRERPTRGSGSPTGRGRRCRPWNEDDPDEQRGGEPPGHGECHVAEHLRPVTGPHSAYHPVEQRHGQEAGPGDQQITPTRLGNAIRRFEEYGYDRYRLDTQVLWNELTSVVPEPTGKFVVTARTNVDFFVALLYGHAAVAVAAFAALPASRADRPLLVFSGICLVVLIRVWYHAAVAATDEWAAAVRALVNLGRRPLADQLGLSLPQSLEDERRMWQLVTRMSNRPYAPAAGSAFEPYRIDPTQHLVTPPPPAS
ncbi:hypothetical protein AB0D65_21710 [Streptomyces griseoloalbus]|uniref:DUF4231 domain-containing protein n=1 Tax=Streptomyces griseoloalbus TaxID=67303 RepID=A0ABV3E9C6_9ACTN